MPCCGKKREEFRARPDDFIRTEVTEQASTLRRMPPQAAVCFEYTGKTGLTALGPISGQRYRFGGPGAIIAADARDAPSLAAVPNLKRVKNPSGFF